MEDSSQGASWTAPKPEPWHAVCSPWSLAAQSPAGLAHLATKGDWIPARHLNLLNERLLSVAAGETKRLLVNMPPRHGKSTLVSQYFPAWYMGVFPDRKILLASYGAEFAETWGRRVRDALQEFGPRLFGVGVDETARSAKRFGLKGRKGGFSCCGAGGPLTGRGADLFIIDDPVKGVQDADSGRLRDRLWDWYRSVAYTRLEKGGAVVLVMTRWRRDDLAGRILEEQHGGKEMWETISLPAVATASDPLGRAVGAPLWPERFDGESLERIRGVVGPRTWSALYQQTPTLAGFAEWPAELFGPSIWFDAWPSDLGLRVVSLDPSKGKRDGYGDYSAIVKVGFCSRGIAWVDADLERRPVPRMIEDVLKHVAEFQPQVTAVESNQFQELVGVELGRLATERGFSTHIHPLENHLPKVTRIRMLGPRLTSGKLKFRAGSPGARLLVEQLQEFPLGSHDDGPDALEMALRVAGMWLNAGQEGTMQE